MNPFSVNQFKSIFKSINTIQKPFDSKTDQGVAQQKDIYKNNQHQDPIDQRINKIRDDYHKSIRKNTPNSVELLQFKQRITQKIENELSKVYQNNQFLHNKVQRLQGQIKDLKQQLRRVIDMVSTLQHSQNNSKLRRQPSVQRQNNIYKCGSKLYMSNQVQSNSFSNRNRQLSLTSISSCNSITADKQQLKYGRQIPDNMCGYSSAMDLIERSSFVKYAQVHIGKIPEITQLAKGNRTQRNYRAIVRKLNHEEYPNYVRPGLLQDTWKIVNLIQKLIIQNGNHRKDNTHLPVFTCQTCNKVMFQGNLDFELKNGNYQIRKIACTKCGENISPTILFTPDDFLMKISGVSSQCFSNPFFRPNPPQFQDYWVPCIVEFNQQLKHYRTLRFSGNNSIVIIDGNDYQIHRNLTWQNKKNIIYSNGWIPYIINYRRKKLKGKTLFNRATTLISVQKQISYFIGGCSKQTKKFSSESNNLESSN